MNPKDSDLLKDNESEKEYFVHASGLIDEIREDDEVSLN